MTLHLVEISPFLATIQCDSLTCRKTKETKDVGEAGQKREKARKAPEESESQQQEEEQPLLDPMKEISSDDGRAAFYHHAIAEETGFPVYWYRDIRDLPQDFHFYIAHEFFDALPVHKIQVGGMR